jgi:hypothetical protein
MSNTGFKVQKTVFEDDTIKKCAPASAANYTNARADADEAPQPIKSGIVRFSIITGDVATYDDSTGILTVKESGVYHLQFSAIVQKIVPSASSHSFNLEARVNDTGPQIDLVQQVLTTAFPQNHPITMVLHMTVEMPKGGIVIASVIGDDDQYEYLENTKRTLEILKA